MKLKDFFTHDFSSLLSNYEEVCAWFDSLGFRFAITRYGIYHKNIQKLSRLSDGEKIFDNITNENLDKSIRELLNSHIEANEIIRIYNDIRKLDSQGYLDQIKKVISGQEFRATSDSDPARDFLFELSTASRFLRAGYNVSLKSVCDIIVDLPDGRQLFVECKRIKSLKKLSKNVKMANQQIVRRVKDSSSLKNIGLVAVNVTDLLPKISPIHLEDIRLVTRVHRDLSRKFIMDNLEGFTAGNNNKCLGVMCESSISKFAPGGIYYSRHTDNLPYHHDALFERLAPQLSNQDII